MKAVDLALKAIALALLASIAVTALHDVSQAWDSGYYHLPFAARLGGIVPREAYVLSPANRGRFGGFPLLGELVQGILWRLTGRPSGANLLAFASVPFFAWFLRRSFAVPAHLTVLGLLAVPLVQTHVTSTYVDLPANAALAALLLIAVRAWASPEETSWRRVLGAIAAATLAANLKTLTHPMVALAFVALGARLVQASADRRERVRKVLAMVASLPLLVSIPLKNLAIWGNPYYPVEMRVLGRVLPGIDTPYSSSPDWLDAAPGPVRFACSLLELGVRPFSSADRWTVDQWMPPGSDGARMGGFFNAYVIANLVLLVVRAVREREGPARRTAAAFAALTFATSWMPQSHELRYHLQWMITLVGINLWLACREGAPRIPATPAALGVGTAIATGVVIAVTGAAWVRPSGSTLDELVARRVDRAAIDRIPAGSRVCVRRAPYTWLWASPFNGAKPYVVVEADRAEECADAEDVP